MNYFGTLPTRARSLFSTMALSHAQYSSVYGGRMRAAPKINREPSSHSFTSTWFACSQDRRRSCLNHIFFLQWTWHQTANIRSRLKSSVRLNSPNEHKPWSLLQQPYKHMTSILFVPLSYVKKTHPYLCFSSSGSNSSACLIPNMWLIISDNSTLCCWQWGDDSSIILTDV